MDEEVLVSVATKKLLACVGCSILAVVLLSIALRQLWILRYRRHSLTPERLWLRNSIGIPGRSRQGPPEGYEPSPWVIRQNYCLVSALMIWGAAALTVAVLMGVGLR